MATLNTASISKGDSKEPNNVFNLVLLGDVAVGKSCFKNWLVAGHFNMYPRTFGPDFDIHTIKIDAITMELRIWDTCGARRFASIAASYYKRAHAAIVMYDITKMHTFLSAQILVKELQCQVSPNIVIALSGNNEDLAHMREVPFEKAEVYAKENQLLFMETSAIEGMNVKDIFEAVAQKLCRTHKEILLQWASQIGDHDAVLSLVDKGADVNVARSDDGWSPLMVASQNGHLDVVLALIGAGAMVNHTNKDGWSPLMVASQHGHFDVVLALIGAGAKVNCTNKDRNKALDIAVKNGHNDVAKVLKARQTEVFSVVATKVHDINKQSEQQLHDMIQQKERTEREMHDLRQLNERTEQQLQVTIKQKTQIEQQFLDVTQQAEQTKQQLCVTMQQKKKTEQELHDMKQQKEETEQLLQSVTQQLHDLRQQNCHLKDTYEKRCETAECTVLKQKLKNNLLKQELRTKMQQASTSQITQTANFMDYNQTDFSVLENSSDDDERIHEVSL